MGIKALFKGAVAATAFVAFSAGVASAQGSACTETQFSSKAGQIYLAAENKLIAEKNPQGALTEINKLRGVDLNCYEQGAVLRLGAAIKIEAGDYAGAVRDLETALNQGYITGKDAPQTYYNIGQIYLSQENLPKAREYMTKWIDAGGQPTRDQKWQLAVISHKMDDNQGAIRWAEEVFETDGPNAKREVYDFLIFLYDSTGQLAKKANLLEQLLAKNPTERKLWDAIAGDYFQANEERKAFEVQKAMYLGGILSTEDELMRIVNFYNRFNAPYHGARILEKEMNAGRINESFEKLELLANLYQVAREFEKAIPVIEKAARMNNSGAMYERLGRSYSELQEWAKAEEALRRAIELGGVKDRGLAWVLIGQSLYERDDRAGAREAFRTASNAGGRGWLSFMQSEDRTEVALARFDIQSKVLEFTNEKEVCDRLKVLGDEGLPEGCADVSERLAAAREDLAEFDEANNV